ncbi:NAD(P)H-dependent oxidoreductase [Paraburkholderia sp. BL10I2N1]|uniref:NAD(P)H-dependent oxidoreductase n=1 Tax=unclassified Paraburkholderia TaxID=2615204 RepID=UPI0010387F95|nr:NAD(P)H-dependent oxidoreductase [Paraburkholderia sp. BL10I2N1]TCG02325.1 hypothetical protein BZM26_00175 [Paraburkholderia strydomiana]TDN62420.1 NAD(P)H dehydrogenase (quinone) [Paraburkholderia sp. BL10I2N1]
MKVLIVHAHPEPKSFNGALTERAIQCLESTGHEVVVSDLYRMTWQPRSSRENFLTTANADFFKQQIEEDYASNNGGFALDVQQEIDKLFACDALIFQFPLWWFSVPAILKGWADRVFAFGKVYGYQNMLETGCLRGRRAMVSVTTGAVESLYTSDKSGLGHIEDILYHVNFGMFRFTGFDVLRPFVSWGPSQKSFEERQEMLDQYEARLSRMWTEEPMTFRERRENKLLVKV